MVPEHLHGGGHPRAVEHVEPLLLGDVAVVVLVRLQEILSQLKVDHCNLQVLHYILQLTINNFIYTDTITINPPQGAS